MMIEMSNIRKSYDGRTPVLDGLNLTIEKGDFVTFLGSSGCGKTTLLKMINKLIPFDSGEIRVNNRAISTWDTIELRRSIGYVLQQAGLFPHMTIENNISYVLTLEGTDKKERSNRAEELIELVGMDKSFLNRYPGELSGGQRQRVGVARALASDPEIILMDEPFGAVDEIARTALQDELLGLQKKLNKTILFVTHDIPEALKLGSKIVLINKGQIEQIGTRDDLLFHPVSEYVKEFLGLKGFKSILDDKIVAQIYEKVSTGRNTVEQMYEHLQNL